MSLGLRAPFGEGQVPRSASPSLRSGCSEEPALLGGQKESGLNGKVCTSRNQREQVAVPTQNKCLFLLRLDFFFFF